ncbi:CaiB/BaiF CoA transferase family protein [Paraburkholderia unamae]|uniref:Crotonobetainyl-CoA:carnitine CoA-transferase CaiB-like acyl-CoA transferase n=2 Tax=Paraburkholderia unamae TaxID=219649 RepID=A0ABX5KUI4_9BURK|nr:CoA transferase [Paraburkholderia unamae]PVX85553.1 crotonobetainyl-CoA:carnitine CoA-transferase CaiB-like acyl-CoA transferase [Paraburkholderia unamae]RAR55238.1 crotonobetainyl-CoA:carnitine CoA-transferase CaiB-like acyl-CoA transferase [Paraburkholderia unamae]CAG9268093.1 Succinyl-CoA--D-citramalate CoA-transferase [Paraburkholderia unamae]
MSDPTDRMPHDAAHAMPLPLAGLQVLELGSTVAGPFCGRLLADFGAHVIKVEPPEGDPLRTMGEHCNGTSLYAASILRNKSLVTIDLRQPEGRALARELALKSDIVVENFKPGSLEKWGLGYDELSAIDPRLIMVRISGYGQTGPYRERAGYGVISEAMSGIRHMTGDPDRPPARVAVSMTDYLTGLYAAFGATLAVLSRQQTGRGQCVDAALYESAFSMMEPFVPAFAQHGTVPARSGSRLAGSVPNSLYESADGSFIAIAAMADAVYRRLAHAMDRADLATDARYANAAARIRNQAALDDEIARWCASLPVAALETRLHEHEVPASRVFTMADIFADPHFQVRGMLRRVPHDALGDVTVTAPLPQLSGTPGAIRHAGGAPGRDSERILKDVLGKSSEEYARLVEAGIVRASRSTA